ncbi:MAG: ATP-binding protein [Polyangiaceae bacterium]|nr:ATP-binding protein [Polyangiaceae bacterium]
MTSTPVSPTAPERRLKAWARPALLIIDDVGLGQVKKRDNEPTAAHTLFNLIDLRHGKASTAVTSTSLSAIGVNAGRRDRRDGDPRPPRHARDPHRHRRPQLPAARRREASEREGQQETREGVIPRLPAAAPRGSRSRRSDHPRPARVDHHLAAQWITLRAPPKNPSTLWRKSAS